jgi:hypothetical protein
MPQYLEDLIAVIPDSIIKPTSSDLEVIQTLDERIRGTREGLATYLKHLEDTSRNKWHLGSRASHRVGWGLSETFKPWESDDSTNLALLGSAHAVRFQNLKKVLDGINGVTKIEDGGIKKVQRMNTKVRRQVSEGYDPHIPDLSRMRVVCYGLKELEEAYFAWRGVANKYDLYENAAINYYTNGKTKYNTPFRGLNTSWVTAGDPQKDLSHVMETEKQFVTNNVRATMSLNHPFDIAQDVNYPSPEHGEWTNNLLIKASIADFEDMR